MNFRAGVSSTTLGHKNGGPTSRMAKSHRVTAWNDGNAKGTLDAGVDLEGPVNSPTSATAR